MAKAKKKVESATSGKSSLNMDENIESLLCYLGGWVTGIIFLVLEKKNRNVKFHAWQSIITFGILSIIGAIFSVIPIIGWLIARAVGVLFFILWIVLMIKAYNKEKWLVPIIGDIIEKNIKY
ncbi:hypothetical protein COT07_02065 [Candidatus Woesearchaeota archaeon CG07_land_8_20_14_0_80_44_23]|nr:MAG: hypothetical protein COT07_02065 [Candidatus Woesearchaeota archaeon CG07_land_8_20_14_0_80_44_23]